MFLRSRGVLRIGTRRAYSAGNQAVRSKLTNVRRNGPGKDDDMAVLIKV